MTIPSESPRMPRWRRTTRLLELPSLIALQLWLGASRFDPHRLPIHDTLQAFHVFYFDYSTLLSSGELARWMPYTTFGQPMDAWAGFTHTPATYLAMLAGLLTGTHDAMLLFKSALAFEELCFLGGLYALVSALFRTRVAVFMVCMCCGLTINSFAQLWWNFRIYAWLPLCLLLLLLWHRHERAWLLWTAGILSLASLAGSLPYYSIFYFYLFSALCAPLILHKPHLLRGILSRSRLDITALACLLVLLATYAYTIATAYNVLAMDSPGRDPKTLDVSTIGFLTHGGVPNFLDLVGQLARGWPIFAAWHHHPDVTLYVGLLPWIVLPCLALHRWTPESRALVAAVAFSLCISLAGVFALAASWLPGMTLFRHLSLLHPVSLLLAALVSGFAMDSLATSGHSRHLVWLALVTLLGLDVFAQPGLISLLTYKSNDGPGAATFARYAFYAVTLALAWLSAALLKRSALNAPLAGLPWIPWLLLAPLLFDLGIYRVHCDAAVALVPRELRSTLETLNASPLPYRATRTADPPDARSLKADALTGFLRTAAGTPHAGINQATYAFTQYDACESRFFAPWKTHSVTALLSRRALESWHRTFISGSAYTAILHHRWPESRLKFDHWRAIDPAFMRVLGCDAPKLRLVQAAYFGHDPAQLVSAVDRIALLDRVAVLFGSGVSSNVVAPELAREPRVLAFTANRLVVSVDTPAPAWLVYADSHDPHWIGSVDGRQVPILPAYLAFKAIAVPPGRHVVRFEYAGSALTSPVRIFGWAAGLVVLAVLGLGLAVARRAELLSVAEGTTA